MTYEIESVERHEMFELLVSWLTISVAFAWDMNPTTFLHSLPFYLLAVGTAFIFHELAHRFVANKLGYPARFIMWREGLLMALGLAVLTDGRFVFAAPGAVYVFGNPNIKENGIISVAGPITNLFVAYLFFFLSQILPASSFLHALFLSIAKVNAFIGFFNMMPTFPLDGSKVLPWNPLVYVLVIALFLPLLFT